MAKKKSSWNTAKKILISLIALLVLSGVGLGVSFYMRFQAPNVKIPNDAQGEYLYVPTATTFDQLVDIIEERGVVKRRASFEWVAQQLKLDENVRPGRYKIEKGMSNLQLVRLLRSGRQTPVKVVLKKFRTKEDLAGFISSKLEIDSAIFITTLNDDVYMQRFGVTPREALALFVPNTHEFYWNTTLDKFMQRMNEAYRKFWNAERTSKAKALGLTPVQATILASIVEEETNAQAEKDDIASVYLNRLKANMLLQADPTVKYAIGDFALRRITSAHTSYDSPYNTYKYTGLPPGPVCTPSTKTLDAVLDASDTPYYYFSADPDRPGYHLFAANHEEHMRNAARYHRSLNKRGIR